LGKGTLPFRLLQTPKTLAQGFKVRIIGKHVNNKTAETNTVEVNDK